MSLGVFVTKQFIDDLERLNKSLRKRFARTAHIFCEDPHNAQLKTEKLHGHVGKGDAYSCRLNVGYRFIWTNEISGRPTLRLVGKHDETYRRAEQMLPVQPWKLTTLEEALQTSCSARKRQSAEAITETQQQQAAQVPEEIYQFSSNELRSLLEGNIASWMLFVPPPHREFISRTFGGPARVTGPSGSGKTALLLHRAVREAQRTKAAQVLIVCFNVALAQVLSSLLDRLCGDEWEVRARIRVSNLDRIATEICEYPATTASTAADQALPRILIGREKQDMLAEACSRVRPLRLTGRFETNLIPFLEKEISVWLKGNPDISYDAYRTLTFPSSHLSLSRAEREEIIRVADDYERIKGTAMDFEDLRNRALAKVSDSATHPFSELTAVLVDEYQDFSVSALKLLLELAKPSGHNVFFSGDERQRIYCSNSSFRQLGIEVRGRALTLATNFRNTRQIAKVASHLTRGIEGDDSEGTLPVEQIAYPALDGPRPVLAGFSKQEDELEWISASLTELLSQDYLPGEIGVLTPTWETRKACARILSRRNFAHFILEGESATRFFEEGAIKLSTYHQAKGLEYKVVFCSGLGSKLFRKKFQYNDMEGKALLSSLLYMAVTRARDRLFLSFSGTPLKWLCTLDHSLVELQRDAALLIIKGQDRLETSSSGRQTQASLGFDQEKK